jgi:hypothetical protein
MLKRALTAWALFIALGCAAMAQSFTGFAPAGQLLVGQGSGAPPSWVTLSGSCTLAANGAISCTGGGGGAVSSVSNSDGTLTISPTTGAVVGSLALGHANTWTATQTFPANSLTLAELPQVGAAKILGNPSGVTANVSAVYTGSNTSSTIIPLLSGAATSGHCVQFADNNGSIGDTGSTCGSGSGASSSSQDFVASNGDFTPGTTTSLTISPAPISGSALTVAFDGIVQSHDTWSVNVNTGVITFNAAIPANVQVVDAQWIGTLVGGAVASVSNTDGTLTITPTTGAVNAKIALAHANTWTAAQTFPNNSLTYAEMPQLAALSVIGNATNATANQAAITGTASQFLGVNSAGTALGFVTISGDVTMSGGAATVGKINGNPLGSTTPTAGNILVASGTQWVSLSMSGACTMNSSAVITCSNSGAGYAGEAHLVGGGTLANANSSQTVDVDCTTACTVTVPAGLNNNIQIIVTQSNTGSVQILAGGGVTVSSSAGQAPTNTIYLSGQGASATLYNNYNNTCGAASTCNTWAAVGNIAP